MLWPRKIPTDWNETWFNNTEEMVYVHNENTDPPKLRWDCSLWDGAQWTFNQKVMIASTLWKQGILKKRQTI